MLEHLQISLHSHRHSWNKPHAEVIITIKNMWYSALHKTGELNELGQPLYTSTYRVTSIRTGIKYHHEQWMGCSTRYGPWIKGNDAPTNERNKLIKDAMDKIEFIYYDYKQRNNGREPKASEMKEIFINGFKEKPRKKFLAEVVPQYIQDNNLIEDSARNYRSFILVFRAYLKSKYNSEDIYADELDLASVYRFEMYIANAKSQKGFVYQKSTARKYFALLKALLAYSSKIDQTPNIGKDHVASGVLKDKPEKVTLSTMLGTSKWKIAPDDLHKIESVPMSGRGVKTDETDEKKPTRNQYNYNLVYTRLLFLLQTWTGMAYADLKQYGRNFRDIISNDLNGKKTIIYNRKKSGELAMIPYTEQIEVILEALEYNAKPNFSYDTYRRAVYQMMVFYGVNISQKRCKTHLGRHLFGSRMLMMGFSMESVSRMMGHASVKITEKIYAQVDIHSIHADYDRLKIASQNLGNRIAI